MLASTMEIEPVRMKFNMVVIALMTVASLTLIGEADADTLTFTGSTTLSNSLSTPSSNFSPQGLGYDASANELLFLQQNSATIYRTDLNGTIVGSRSLGSNGGDASTFTVSVAADASNYYFSSYVSNSSGLDLYGIGKASGNYTNISSETAAFGGYPIDVRNGLVYRTNPSTGYNYSDLNLIRVANINTPDTITQTLTLNTPSGIGDFSIDAANKNIFVLNYSNAASIYRYDLTSGALLQTYNLNLNGLTGGLTFANDVLYYYDYKSGTGSTLSKYTFTAAAASTPEPGNVALMVSMVISGAGFLSHRRRARKAA
jgi:hypothetical protein